MSEGYDYDNGFSDNEIKHKKKKKKVKKERRDSSPDVKEEAKYEYESDDIKEEYKSDSGSDYEQPQKKKKKKATPRKTVKKEAGETKKRKSTAAAGKSPTKKVKKEEKPEDPKWEWWNEDPEEKRKREEEGIKWMSLGHKGPFFPPEYERLPSSVKFKYDGEHVVLSDATEEVMGFYAAMLRTDYVTDPVKSELFNKNFFSDWRKEMTDAERKKIKSLDKCDFTAVLDYFDEQREIKKNRTKEEKQVEKEKNLKVSEEYGFCMWDKHKEKIGNFRLEPPGLFRGRGEHPKMGRLKKRITANDIIINISKGEEVPTPPPGQKWKEVRNDNKVTWLACWIENVQGQYKYIMLNANSRIKGEKDWLKYEKARKLKDIIGEVRRNYEADLQSKMMADRQRAVAMYFIDKLALRAGNEKDTEEAADTVGCCSLRVEHVKLHDEYMLDGEKQQYVIEFDFLGKDSMRYHNFTQVTKRVFKNVRIFCENKSGEDELFDRLDTGRLNKHLNSIMDGLTAKVFRTYNASKTLQEQLDETTKKDLSVAEYVLTYNNANRQVAILCNHKRTAPKTFDDQMKKAEEKISDKEEKIKEKKKELKAAKKNGDDTSKKKQQLARLEDQLIKLKCAKTDREENKEIALGTSKLNYLDPRITIGWAKKWDVPIEKVYNKTQRDKFAWAIAMAGSDFSF